MHSVLWTAVSCLMLCLHDAAAVPTWPSPMDELEDIMFLQSGYRSRNFAVPITPCSKSPAPGRIATAEYIRTAFHDMATGNVFSGVGGMDASIMFELSSGEHLGAGFRATVNNLMPYHTSRSSMSDLLAIGLYAAVRSCGGPIVPVKAGRRDAEDPGPSGVPLPQNAISIFINQFARIGFSSTEMIALVACGHTVGGVHSANFPQIVPPGSAPNGFREFDTTDAFDEKIATEYLSSSTQDPLVVGPSVANSRNSDARVFNSDRNVTITTMANPATFQSVCRTMLQKMIEVVPSGVTLTDPIEPYEVKPVAVQLSLIDDATLSFSGEIRIRTTGRMGGDIASVQLLYKDRDGGNDCGDCIISTSIKGAASGFDDSFMFFGFSKELSVTSSISAFRVKVTTNGGSSEVFDNNGSGFALRDTIMLQPMQSCLNDGRLTVVAAVRSSAATSLVNLALTVPTPRDNTPVPKLVPASVPMTEQLSVGPYKLFTASYLLDSSQLQSTHFDVTLGSGSSAVADSFKFVRDLSSTCAPLGSGLSTTSSSATVASATSDIVSTTASSVTASASASSTISTTPSSTPSSDYAYEGCFTDSQASRAFTGAVFYDNALTISKCGSDCINFKYFGLEYGGECYCGNQRSSSSTSAQDSDCNMPCSGNGQEICGAGNRLSVYSNSKFVEPTSPPSSSYLYLGCYDDPVNPRLLQDESTASNSMSVEKCAAYCANSTYFGVEYGTECYCDDAFPSDAVKKPESDCYFRCAGNNNEFCGAGFRINVFKSNTLSVLGYAYQGCRTDSVGARVLTAKSTWSNSLTYESCATFCSGYLYFGVEYATECFCGNEFTNPTESAPEDQCSMACSGDATKKCGGPSRLNLFKSTSSATPATPATIAPSGYRYAGCYTDSVGARTLNGPVLFSASMTVQTCKDFCAGSRYFGVEYGGECYCGKEFANPSTAASESGCNSACNGNPADTCGGANRLSLFEAI